MNATAEATERSVRVEEQARIVSALLKEYADKLAALNAELIEAKSDPYGAARTAWLLDQGELLWKPLSQIMSRGSGLLEHSDLPSVIDDELTLRMREIEIHLHHTLRLTHELRQMVEDDKRLTGEVAKLRVAAGLNAMKGGPLRPE